MSRKNPNDVVRGKKAEGKREGGGVKRERVNTPRAWGVLLFGELFWF
jgi:hypothetical protein